MSANVESCEEAPQQQPLQQPPLPQQPQEVTRRQAVNDIVNQRYVVFKFRRMDDTIHSIDSISCFDDDAEQVDHSDYWLTAGSPFQVALEAKQIRDIPVFAVPYTQLGLLIDCGPHARRVRYVRVNMTVSNSHENPQNYQVVNGFFDHPIRLLDGFPLVSFTPTQCPPDEREEIFLPHIMGCDYRLIPNEDIKEIEVSYNDISINGNTQDLDVIPMPNYSNVSVYYESDHTLYLEAVPQPVVAREVNIMGTHVMVGTHNIRVV